MHLTLHEYIWYVNVIDALEPVARNTKSYTTYDANYSNDARNFLGFEPIPHGLCVP